MAVMIVFSGFSLAANVFALTHHALDALEWGGAFSVVRALVEFRPFHVRRGKKLAAMAGLTLAMVALDAVIALASAGHPRDWPGLLSLLVSSLGFFLPELVIWNLANAPAICRTYEVARHGSKLIALPSAGEGDWYEFHLFGWSMDHLAPFHIGLEVFNPECTIRQELGIIRMRTYISTLPVPAGQYVLQIANHSPSSLEVTLEVHVRTFHL